MYTVDYIVSKCGVKHGKKKILQRWLEGALIYKSAYVDIHAHIYIHVYAVDFIVIVGKQNKIYRLTEVVQGHAAACALQDNAVHCVCACVCMYVRMYGCVRVFVWFDI